jgi:hypothetical protein
MVMKERRSRPRRPDDAKDKGNEMDHVRQGEQAFKLAARRNKLLGLWAAAKLGMSGDRVEVYVKQVVVSDLEEPGDEDVIRKVMKDFTECGVEMTREQLLGEMGAFEEVARRQIEAEES